MPAQRLTQPYPFCLHIERLALPVHLGVTEAERDNAQTVYADVQLYYPAAPDASMQDVSDYQCYDSLCKAMLATAQEKPVQLIEFLVGELYRCLREQIDPVVKIRVRLHKPLPKSLVGYEVGGATAEYTDLLEGLT